MIRLIAALLLLVALPLSARNVPEPRSVSIAVDVDAKGRVSSAEVRDKLPEATVQRLIERVRQFEFTPARRDGQAHPLRRERQRDAAPDPHAGAGDQRCPVLELHVHGCLRLAEKVPPL